MSYVLVTFMNVYCVPKTCDTLYQLILCSWFHNTQDVLFKFMPEVFNWIHIQGFGWRFPPVDMVSPHPVTCILRSTFRVVILHKSMFSRQCLIDEWHKVFSKICTYMNLFMIFSKMQIPGGSFFVCLYLPRYALSMVV